MLCGISIVLLFQLINFVSINLGFYAVADPKAETNEANKWYSGLARRRKALGQ